MKGSQRQGTAVALIALLLCHLPHPGGSVPIPADIQSWLDSQDCMGLYPPALPTTNVASEFQGDGGSTTSAAFRPALWTRQIAALRSGSRAAGRHMLGSTSSGTTQMRGMAPTAVATDPAVQAAQDRALATLNDLYEVEGDLNMLATEIDAYVTRTGMVPLSVNAVINDVLGGGTDALPADRVRLAIDRYSKALILTMCVELPALFEGAEGGPGRRLTQIESIASVAFRTMLEDGDYDWVWRGLGMLTGIALGVTAGAVVVAAAPVVAGIVTAAFAGSATVVGAAGAVGSIAASVGLGVAVGEAESAIADSISKGDNEAWNQGLKEGKIVGDLGGSVVSGYYGGVSKNGFIRNSRSWKGFEWIAKEQADIGNLQAIKGAYPDILEMIKNWGKSQEGTISPDPEPEIPEDPLPLSPEPLSPAPTQELPVLPQPIDETSTIPTSCGKDYSNIDAEYGIDFALPVETARCATLAGRRELEAEWKKLDPFQYPECAGALASGVLLEVISRSCDCYACETGQMFSCAPCRAGTMSVIPKECRTALVASTVPYSFLGLDLGTMGEVYKENMDDCGVDY